MPPVPAYSVATEAPVGIQPGLLLLAELRVNDRCGMELTSAHPGSLGLAHFLPGNQSPGRGFFFWNIGIGLAVFE